MERLEKTIDKKNIKYDDGVFHRAVIDLPIEDIDYAEVVYYVDYDEETKDFIFSSDTLRIYDTKGHSFNYSEGSGIHMVTPLEYSGSYPEPKGIIIDNQRIFIEY